LFVLERSIARNENVEAGLLCCGEKLAIVQPRPSHKNRGKRFMVTKEEAQIMR